MTLYNNTSASVFIECGQTSVLAMTGMPPHADSISRRVTVPNVITVSQMVQAFTKISHQALSQR